MAEPFINLPTDIEKSISEILTSQESTEWARHAVRLHDRYQNREKDTRYIVDYSDALAYLALRVPATYAQIYAALSKTSEMVPSWRPQTTLDLGSGPGTGFWAAKNVFSTIASGTLIDQDSVLLSIGKEILQKTGVSDLSFLKRDLRQGIDNVETGFDVVILGNVLNELSISEGERLLGQAFNLTKGILLIVEPGTPVGSSVAQAVAKKLRGAGALLAPYVNNTFVETRDYWLHFPAHFKRPDFLRRIRQSMRDSKLMASDWEETKFSYAAIGKMPAETAAWGRAVGPMKKQKGFLELPVLTDTGVQTVKIMQRNKQMYAYGKNISWGDFISERIE